MECISDLFVAKDTRQKSREIPGFEMQPINFNN